MCNESIERMIDFQLLLSSAHVSRLSALRMTNDVWIDAKISLLQRWCFLAVVLTIFNGENNERTNKKIIFRSTNFWCEKHILLAFWLKWCEYNWDKLFECCEIAKAEAKERKHRNGNICNMKMIRNWSFGQRIFYVSFNFLILGEINSREMRFLYSSVSVCLWVCVRVWERERDGEFTSCSHFHSKTWSTMNKCNNSQTAKPFYFQRYDVVNSIKSILRSFIAFGFRFRVRQNHLFSYFSLSRLSRSSFFFGGVNGAS